MLRFPSVNARKSPALHYAAPMNHDAPPRCWVLSDGAAGNERQALALAQAMSLTPRVIRLHIREPWNALAPRLLPGARFAVRDDQGRPLQPPWPDLAIGCGRRAALATRALRHWSAGRCFCVQILDPRIDCAQFDLVIAPAHDGLSGANVIASIGALHGIDALWLAQGRARFPIYASLPSPRMAVLVGGSTRAQPLDLAYFNALLERLGALQAHEGGSFLVSVSRRTPPAISTHLRARFAAMPGVFWSGPADGDNPYAGLLGWAERILVTPDSVNMLSEACATGRPVYTFVHRPIRGKLAAFHAELAASGHLRHLGEVAPAVSVPPLLETREISALVRERWLQHRAQAADTA